MPWQGSRNTIKNRFLACRVYFLFLFLKQESINQALNRAGPIIPAVSALECKGFFLDLLWAGSSLFCIGYAL